MAKSRARHRIENSALTLSPSAKTNFNWSILLIVVVCSAITGGIVRFSDNIHYNSALLQASSQTNSAQSQLEAEQHDMQFIISHDSSQLNCYELQSSFDRNLCDTHNQ